MQNILVITACPGIGDMVVRIPLFYALKAAYPSARVSLVIRNRPELHDIAKGIECVDEIYIQDRGYKKIHFWKTLFFGLHLRHQKFDAIFVLGKSRYRDPFLAYLSGAKVRIGYDTKLGPGRWFLTHLVRSHKDLHESKNLMKVLEPLNIAFPDSSKKLLCVDKETKEELVQILKRIGVDLDQEKIVILHPCANFAGRRWERKRFSVLADYLNSNFKVKVLLTGSLKDEAYLKDIVIHATTPIVNLAGKLNMLQLMTLFQHTALMISVDSGPMHLASVMGTPVISLFGPSDPKRWAPMGVEKKIIYKDLECSPCPEKCIYSTHRCMEAIETSEVISQIKLWEERLR